MIAENCHSAKQTLSFEQFGTARPPLAKQAAEKILEQYSGRKDILLVDDEPVNREVGLALLDFPGIKVKMAADGLEAVKLVASYRFDLILMDVHMPRMDGIEAVRLIRKMPHGIGVQIITLTADSRFENREYSSSLGMDDCLLKPINPDLLYQKVLWSLQIIEE